MSSRTMMLIAGVLATMAFMALGGSATAKETKLKCEGSGLCTFTVTSGVSNFSMSNSDTIKCETVVGNGAITGLDAERESSTGEVQLLLTGCKEQNTIFHFSCSNTATAGNLTTNVMVVHSIALPGTAHEAGTLMTGLNVTFNCVGGFAASQVTGSIIGESESRCNSNTSTVHKGDFRTTGDGAQSLTSYTGNTFRLEGKTSHTGGGSYLNSAQDGTATFTFNQNTIVTCA